MTDSTFSPPARHANRRDALADVLHTHIYNSPGIAIASQLSISHPTHTRHEVRAALDQLARAKVIAFYAGGTYVRVEPVRADTGGK